MSDNNHPITPPPELMQQWWEGTHGALYEFEAVATQAARWGADQELEACYAWVTNELNMPGSAICLREDRRPKPPSLKEQALDELQSSFGRGYLKKEGADTIRRALESLPD